MAEDWRQDKRLNVPEELLEIFLLGPEVSQVSEFPSYVTRVERRTLVAGQILHTLRLQRRHYVQANWLAKISKKVHSRTKDLYFRASALNASVYFLVSDVESAEYQKATEYREADLKRSLRDSCDVRVKMDGEKLSNQKVVEWILSIPWDTSELEAVETIA